MVEDREAVFTFSGWFVEYDSDTLAFAATVMWNSSAILAHWILAVLIVRALLVWQKARANQAETHCYDIGGQPLRINITSEE